MKWEEMATVGRIARAHGIRGEVVIDPQTDFPEARFRPGAELFVERDGRPQPLTLRRVRFHGGRPVVAVGGVDTRTEAEGLSNRELRVPVTALASLPPGTFYRHELVGCRVETAAGTVVGAVTRVEGTLSGSRLVVAAADGREVLIPLVAAICTTIAPSAGRIVIEPPEGLLDLNR